MHQQRCRCFMHALSNSRGWHVACMIHVELSQGLCVSLPAIALQDLYHLYIGSPATEAEAAVFRFTWKLFIVAKAKLFAPFPDLVASFNLLICVLAFVYCHIPAAQQAVSLTDEVNLPRRTKEGAVDVLQVQLLLLSV